MELDLNISDNMCCRVDMFIPTVDVVGGFSMSSSPQRLATEGVLELAVKYALHPPAFWVHTQVDMLPISLTKSEIVALIFVSTSKWKITIKSLQVVLFVMFNLNVNFNCNFL